MQLRRTRAACADTDSALFSLQNVVVVLQSRVAPSLVLAAAFPPPPGDNDSDGNGVKGEGPCMLLLRLAVLPQLPDQTHTDAAALIDEEMMVLSAGRCRNAVSKLESG